MSKRYSTLLHCLGSQAIESAARARLLQGERVLLGIDASNDVDLARGPGAQFAQINIIDQDAWVPSSTRSQACARHETLLWKRWQLLKLMSSIRTHYRIGAYQGPLVRVAGTTSWSWWQGRPRGVRMALLCMRSPRVPVGAEESGGVAAHAAGHADVRHDQGLLGSR